jgi:hypothetical protein
MTAGPRVIAYGGGVQSTALLVLAATGRIEFPTFLFCNVGDDSEHPDTLAYVREVAVPYAAANGITLEILDRHRRDGTTETLYGRLTAPESRSLPIPVRMANGAPGQRSCTADFKIRVIAKWTKARGATPETPATIGIGISVDEIERANNRKVEPHEEIVYPLLELGLRRTDCQRVILEAGLPVPGKSACYFCPFHRVAMWEDMARDRPDLFNRAADLEATLNTRRDTLGKDHVYLTRYGMPLRDAISDRQLVLFDDGAESCDSGYCMT